LMVTRLDIMAHIRLMKFNSGSKRRALSKFTVPI